MFAWLFSMLYFSRRAVTCFQDVIDLLNTQQQCFQTFKQTKWFDSLLTAKGASLLHSRPDISWSTGLGDLWRLPPRQGVFLSWWFTNLFPQPSFSFLFCSRMPLSGTLRKGTRDQMSWDSGCLKKKALFSSLVGSLATYGITGCESLLLNTLFKISLIHMWFIGIFFLSIQFKIWEI